MNSLLSPMKAWRLYKPGDLRLELVSSPKPKPGEALVAVAYCGICSSDIPRIYESGMYFHPATPGHEISGIVVEVGDPRDKSWVGTRVAVFPLLPCFTCKSCRQGNYETCSNYGYLGSRNDGGFAEYVKVPIWNLLRLSDSFDLRHAALLEPVSVALHAVKRAKSLKDKRVCVVGTGFIGLMVAQWSQLYGAQSVNVRGRSNKKKALIEHMGLHYGFEKDEAFYDVVFECVGSTDAIREAIELTEADGCVVLVGNPKSDILISKEMYWKLLRSQLTVVGSWNSSYSPEDQSDWCEAKLALKKRLLNVDSLITDVVSLTELKEGLQEVITGIPTSTKILVGG